MNELFLEIDKKIREYDTIIIHRHTRPDGDAIGSAMGLREILKDTFRDKKVYCAKDEVPEYLRFLGAEDDFDIENYNNALVIVVDTSVKERIGNKNYEKGKEIIKIDHHPITEDFGDISLVCEKYGSCSLIIAEMCEQLGYKISKEAARYLFTSIVTDTGRFKFANVDGKAMRIAGELIDKGLDTTNIYTNLYTKNASDYRLQSYVYKHMKFTESGVCYMYMTKRIRNKFNVGLEDASSCVSLFENIRGSMIWVLFIEHDKEIRVRLRSRYINIRPIAEKFNGGGHNNACGATIYNKKQMNNVLELADQALSEFKSHNEDRF